jgi:hypothetical protein
MRARWLGFCSTHWKRSETERWRWRSWTALEKFETVGVLVGDTRKDFDWKVNEAGQDRTCNTPWSQVWDFTWDKRWQRLNLQWEKGCKKSRDVYERIVRVHGIDSAVYSCEDGWKRHKVNNLLKGQTSSNSLTFPGELTPVSVLGSSWEKIIEQRLSKHQTHSRNRRPPHPYGQRQQ